VPRELLDTRLLPLRLALQRRLDLGIHRHLDRVPGGRLVAAKAGEVDRTVARPEAAGVVKKGRLHPGCEIALGLGFEVRAGEFAEGDFHGDVSCWLNEGCTTSGHCQENSHLHWDFGAIPGYPDSLEDVHNWGRISS
jgi:hypothetical protein